MIHKFKQPTRLAILAMFLFALISGIANAEDHAISSNNFTMLRRHRWFVWRRHRREWHV